MNEQIKEYTKGVAEVFNKHDGTVDVVISVNIEKITNKHKVNASFKGRVEYVSKWLLREISNSHSGSVDILKHFCGNEIYDETDVYEPKSVAFMVVKFSDTKNYNHFKLSNTELFNYWKTTSRFIHDENEEEI